MENGAPCNPFDGIFRFGRDSDAHSVECIRCCERALLARWKLLLSAARELVTASGILVTFPVGRPGARSLARAMQRHIVFGPHARAIPMLHFSQCCTARRQRGMQCTRACVSDDDDGDGGELSVPGFCGLSYKRQCPRGLGTVCSVKVTSSAGQPARLSETHRGLPAGARVRPLPGAAFIRRAAVGGKRMMTRRCEDGRVEECGGWCARARTRRARSRGEEVSSSRMLICAPDWGACAR